MSREERKRFWVAAAFWDDHCDRCPSDDAENGMATEVQRKGSRVLVEGAEAQIRCLLSDAQFYAGMDGPDEAPPEILRSARRVRDALLKAGVR